ncbi:hypothetical protein FHS94_001364 [Sphingomonas aerophila]|uniref:DNA-binding protein n=1 Tax=Sphingomonas aerophila TaxID=1344948 RepID=A0A7W9EVI1_9SPHN|nr:hypothetical protein [Sphingomonas aerophila]
MDDPMQADLLYGLEAIGRAIGLGPRQVQYLHEKEDFPTFKLGRTVCARRSSLAQHFAEGESAARLKADEDVRRQPGADAGRRNRIHNRELGHETRMGESRRSAFKRQGR